MSELIVPVIGYAASILLAISLLMSNDLKFRWLNTWGCISFYYLWNIDTCVSHYFLTNSLIPHKSVPPYKNLQGQRRFRFDRI